MNDKRTRRWTKTDTVKAIGFTISLGLLLGGILNIETDQSLTACLTILAIPILLFTHWYGRSPANDLW